MPDPHRIKAEFQTILARPQFSSLFVHFNQFKSPKFPDATPANVSERAADYLWKNNPLMSPVEIVELKGPLELYRAHDGASNVRHVNGFHLMSAGTVGRSWVERSVAETIWAGTAQYQGKDRFDHYMEFMRTSNFVLPEWNSMLQIACMFVPAGASVAVARGRGDWKAMRTPANIPRPGGPAVAIKTAADVMTHAGMMPIPGVVQCFVPFFNDNWVRPVPYPSSTWPFIR